mmetsp:Transcript_11870/g.33914  ORF Transcript_11870/g.33914 Transcript_11870/m.33914 type:complete len:312 (-) Transcript_11870:612-1547(-)
MGQMSLLVGYRQKHVHVALFVVILAIASDVLVVLCGLGEAKGVVGEGIILTDLGMLLGHVGLEGVTVVQVGVAPGRTDADGVDARGEQYVLSFGVVEALAVVEHPIGEGICQMVELAVVDKRSLPGIGLWFCCFGIGSGCGWCILVGFGIVIANVGRSVNCRCSGRRIPTPSGSIGIAKVHLRIVIPVQQLDHRTFVVLASPRWGCECNLFLLHLINVILKSGLEPCKGIARGSPPTTGPPPVVSAKAKGAISAAVVFFVARMSRIPQGSAGRRMDLHRPSSPLIQVFKLVKRTIHRSLTIHGQGCATVTG